MDDASFKEYEPIIRYSLDCVGFEESVIVLPSLSTFLYVYTKYRKDCIVDTNSNLLTILLPYRPLILYPGPMYTVIGKVDLAQPDSIKSLGLLLSEVLICSR